MRIQHNIAALNSYRQLGGNNNAVSKNLEKLSSGYRINRAGDDAAGLAISEKMRAQITGLETAQKNANDGISLVQTAEGALTEVHSMLNRMVELADQSANGTYDNDVDRANLQKEISSLKDEIDRISEGTNFNGIKLLDGSLASKSGATSIETVMADGTVTTQNSGNGKAFNQEITIVAGTQNKEQVLSLKYIDKDGNVQNAEVKFQAGATLGDTADNAVTELKKIFGDGYNVTNNNGKVQIQATENRDEETQIISVNQTNDGATTTATVGAAVLGKADYFSFDLKTMDMSKGNSITVDGQKYQILSRGNESKLENGAKGIYLDKTTGVLGSDDVAQIVSQLKDYGVNASVDSTTKTIINITQAVAGDTAEGGLTLQIGDTAQDFNQLQVNVGNMSAEALGISSIDISTQAGAKTAVDKIKAAINTVSSTRGDLGAIQNRLEHTINNLGVTAENMTAAESRIRDVDMASEMMEYTKNNILVQASQSMLAQANQMPQGVLQLLQ